MICEVRDKIKKRMVENTSYYLVVDMLLTKVLLWLADGSGLRSAPRASKVLDKSGPETSNF